MYSIQHLKNFHKFAFGNKTSIQNSHLCGCFQCGMIFQASKVTDWTKEKILKETGWCPYCGIDSLIGDVDQAITPSFLEAMKDFWFNGDVILDENSFRTYESFDGLLRDWLKR